MPVKPIQLTLWAFFISHLSAHIAWAVEVAVRLMSSYHVVVEDVGAGLEVGDGAGGSRGCGQIILPDQRRLKNCSTGHTSTPLNLRGRSSSERRYNLASGYSSLKAFSPLVSCEPTFLEDFTSMAGGKT